MSFRNPSRTVFATLASPALFEAQGRLSYAIADPEVIDPRIRETAILRVAHLSNSAYELHHHGPLARAAGLSDAEIAAIGDQSPSPSTQCELARRRAMLQAWRRMSGTATISQKAPRVIGPITSSSSDALPSRSMARES